MNGWKLYAQSPSQKDNTNISIPKFNSFIDFYLLLPSTESHSRTEGTMLCTLGLHSTTAWFFQIISALHFSLTSIVGEIILNEQE